jgi:hypothetical protein
MVVGMQSSSSSWAAWMRPIADAAPAWVWAAAMAPSNDDACPAKRANARAESASVDDVSMVVVLWS